MADKVNKDYKTEVGRLYSTGIDYDNARDQFLSKASENSYLLLEDHQLSINQIPVNDLVSQFDEAWSEYEHMKFAALSFMKGKI